MHRLQVMAAVLRREDTCFVARRASGRALAGCWEFPGGKAGEGESPVAALVRELHEELGIQATIGDCLHVTDHDRDGPPLRLCFYAVTTFTGDLRLRDHDAARWQHPRDMDPAEFAPADREFVRTLQAAAAGADTDWLASLARRHAQG